MKELLLHAGFWLKLLARYLEPVRLAVFLYQAACWLIKLPGRAVNAYRALRDLFRFLRGLPSRMVEEIIARGVEEFALWVGHAVAVIVVSASVGTALFVVAKGTAITKG